MKLLLTILILLISIPLFSFESIKAHHPTYIIGGDKDNQVKYQISFKYPLIYPFDSGICVAYTQLAHWNLYDKSSPFKELNHNPEIFIERNNPNKYIDFFRIAPYSHTSNGLDGENSRSIDACYAELQLSHTAGFLNFGIREKIIGYLNIGRQNYNYRNYRGNFETEFFCQIPGKITYFNHTRLYFKGEFTKHFYWYEAGLSFKIITNKFRPHIYIQYFRGYTEFLIDYNQKKNALRAGFIFDV
jgi:phospholipase A1/A2